jgi:hypothetical protein
VTLLTIPTHPGKFEQSFIQSPNFDLYPGVLPEGAILFPGKSIEISLPEYPSKVLHLLTFQTPILYI